jgi:hypothetical protein
MAEKMKCPLDDCTERPKNGTGYAAHCRSHVLRGEAIFDKDGKTLIRVPEVPIVTEPYDRKLRMDAIKRGEIKAQLHLPSAAQRKNKTAIVPATRGPYKKKNHVNIPPAPNGDGLPFDLSKLTPNQVDQLRSQLFPQGVVEDHSCPTTRAMDRMKQAIVMTQCAELLDEMPADQMLLMMTQMRQLSPMMPTQRRNGR